MAGEKPGNEKRESRAVSRISSARDANGDSLLVIAVEQCEQQNVDRGTAAGLMTRPSKFPAVPLRSGGATIAPSWLEKNVSSEL